MIGKTISHYKITEKLGEGGMGIVYEAVDTKLDRTVALKFLPPESTRDTDAKARFIHEAKAASALDHPNVCNIHEIDSTDDGQLFIVMACYEGETLKDRIVRGQLPIDEAADITRQVAEGLAIAHEREIVHRDIKPANIFITEDGVVKILDFGLAKLAGQTLLTKTGATMGTANYMSPEQAKGQAADHRSDLWCLGVVLYEMVTGSIPFPGENYEAVIYGILHTSPPPPGEDRPGLARQIERVIEKCLTKDPNNRYNTARDLIFDLGGLQVSKPYTVKGLTSTPTALRWGVSAALMLALVAVGVWWIWLRGETTNEQVPSILVIPLEVTGQGEGAAHVGKAFAQAVAVNLSPSKSLHVLPVLTWREIEPGSRTFARLVEDQKIGFLLIGSMTRADTAVTISVTLVDALANRVLWGTQEIAAANELARVAASVSDQLLEYLGVIQPRLYEYFRYVSGSPKMATWPDLPDVISALRRHDPERGLALTERLLEAFPSEYDAHVMRVVALLDASWVPNEHNRRETALREGLAALERIDPQAPILTIINPDHDVDHPDKAINELSRLLDRNDLAPGCRAHALRTRGTWFSILENTTTALADLEEAIRLDPANTWNYNYLSDVLSRAGRFEEALVRARQAAALDPVLQWDIANVAAKLGLWEEALKARSKLVELYDDQVTYASFALALQQVGRHDDAIAAAETAEQRPETAAGAITLAGVWAQLGNRDRALHFLRRALDLGATSRMIAAEDRDLFVTFNGQPEFEAIMSEFEALPTQD